MFTIANATNCAGKCNKLYCKTHIKYLVINTGTITTIPIEMNKKYQTFVLVVLQCVESLVSMEKSNVNYIGECESINTWTLIIFEIKQIQKVQE